MATADASQAGMIGDANNHSAIVRGETIPYTPAYYNQTYITYYKMMGKCSLEASGWDFWENTTGDETGRTVHGVQEAGTVVATRQIAQDF